MGATNVQPKYGQKKGRNIHKASQQSEMRINVNVLAHGPRGAKIFPFIPHYLSINVGNIVTSTMCQATVSIASNGVLNEDDHSGEQINNSTDLVLFLL